MKGIPIATGEKLEWLNAIVAHIWPKVDDFVRKILQEKVEPEMNKNMPSMLKGLKFHEVSLGTKTPQLGPVSTYETIHDGSKLKIDVDYDSDIHFEVGWTHVKAGVQRLRIKGQLTAVLDQFIGDVPVVGGIVVYFVKTPEVTTEFTKLLGALDLGPVKSAFNFAVAKVLEHIVVLPNYVPIALGGPNKGVDRAIIRSLPPRGILRVTLLGVHTDKNHDNEVWGLAGMLGDKSDIYARFALADQSWTSSVVKDNLNPTWHDNNVMEFLVYDRTQELKMEVWDDDHIKDDWIGHAIKGAGDVATGTHWVPMLTHEGHQGGSLHIKAEFFGTDIKTEGNFGKCFIVVEVRGLDMPGGYQYGNEAIVKAVVPGVGTQQTPKEGIFKGLEKALMKEATKQGAVFPAVNIDRAMYFLADKGSLRTQRVILHLLDASGNPISPPDKPLTVHVAKALAAKDLGDEGPFEFHTPKGKVKALMRIAVWGLTRDL